MIAYIYTMMKKNKYIIYLIIHSINTMSIDYYNNYAFSLVAESERRMKI
jgi:hypothetical protein